MGYLVDLNLTDTPNYPYKVPMPHYGADLRDGKARLKATFIVLKVIPERRALFVVMAMIESKHLREADRDAKKDQNKDGSANASIFDLNEDMVRRLGYDGEFHALDRFAQLGTCVQLMNKGIDKWGIRSFLDFVRGGDTTFRDHYSNGASGYRRGVATGVSLIEKDSSLLDDDRRVEMDIPYV